MSFEEAATAELVALRLAEWGYQVTRNVGGHGVVGTLQRGAGGRNFSVRAGMDAVPILEASDAAHASRHAGKRHACGHDGHPTMLLGAARQLATPSDFSGTVHLVFQPAEEDGRNSGVQQMIADGLFERFPCDAEQVVAPFGPVTGSEDLAYYLQHTPGFFPRMGNGEGSPMLHNAGYDFNDANLPIGAAYWTRLVERFLAVDPG